MTPNAVGLALLFGEQAFSAEYIHNISHRLNVIRIHTAPVPARMVANETRRHFSELPNVRDSMGKPGLFAKLTKTIAVFI
jgi:hypothetical protein